MRSWGWTLILVAALSALLPYMGLQLLLVAWVDMWGPTIGWAIRGGLAVIGAAMVVAGSSRGRGGPASGA
ncbi:MAG: hypothetical protein JNK35_00120 [Phycisphaerae bacterium]|nr:hypothetical protein [Phycisphaerae bacterium]